MSESKLTQAIDKHYRALELIENIREAMFVQAQASMRVGLEQQAMFLYKQEEALKQARIALADSFDELFNGYTRAVDEGGRNMVQALINIAQKGK